MDQPQKVTKRQTIEALLKEGKKAKEVQVITRFSLGYIKNVKEAVGKSGIWNRRQKLYLKNNPEKKRAKIRNYRINHPEKRAKSRKLNVIRHTIATRSNAINHRQEWTTKDIEYLEQHGQLKTIRQLALDLGRTYKATLEAGNRYKIDLRGNKTKTHSSRVPPKSAQPTPNPPPILTT